MTATNPAIDAARTHRACSEDWRGLGDLIELSAERLTDPVEQVHDVVADHMFGLTRTRDTHGHTAHRAFTRSIYGSARLLGSIARTALSTGASSIERYRPVPPLWDSRVGAGIQAAANALWGDEFERRASPMHSDLAIRDSGGAVVPSDAATLARAFPSPTRRLAVFLHGLGKTEHCWDNKVDDSRDIAGLADALEADSFTPVLIRYNTGRSVSDNGVALASVLEEVVANWPVAVEEIVLVGHSMGGLVARSSLQAGVSIGHGWIHRVRHVVGLGTPHFGSPIEKTAHVASTLLDRSRVSRPLGEFVDGRSAGIKDMRHGTIHTMHHSDPAADVSGSHAVVASPVDGVRHHHVAGVVTDNASHPFGVLVGDLVVRTNSAMGIASGKRLEATNMRIFGSLNHLEMLHDAAVLAQIREWLTPPPRPRVEATS